VLWDWMGPRNRVRWEYRDAEGRCHGNIWLLLVYNFGCMIASDTLFDFRGRFSGSSYPMETIAQI